MPLKNLRSLECTVISIIEDGNGTMIDIKTKEGMIYHMLWQKSGLGHLLGKDVNVTRQIKELRESSTVVDQAISYQGEEGRYLIMEQVTYPFRFKD